MQPSKNCTYDKLNLIISISTLGLNLILTAGLILGLFDNNPIYILLFIIVSYAAVAMVLWLLYNKFKSRYSIRFLIVAVFLIGTISCISIIYIYFIRTGATIIHGPRL
jgi:hypothetical protein